MEYLSNGKIKVKNVVELRKIVAKGEIDLSLIDIEASNLKDLSSVFRNIKKINGDISNWNTKNVEFMNSTFEGCEDDINISGWRFNSVKDCNWMLWKCTKLEKKFGKIPSGVQELLPWIEKNLIPEKNLDDYLDNYDLDDYVHNYDLNQ